jgi:hypothetical protein
MADQSPEKTEASAPVTEAQEAPKIETKPDQPELGASDDAKPQSKLATQSSIQQGARNFSTSWRASHFASHTCALISHHSRPDAPHYYFLAKFTC